MGIVDVTYDYLEPAVQRDLIVGKLRAAEQRHFDLHHTLSALEAAQQPNDGRLVGYQAQLGEVEAEIAYYRAERDRLVSEVGK